MEMTEQEKEIKSIKPRKYELKLSDADVERIAKKAGSYGLTVSELLENFIGDLVYGTYTNGSDERMYAQQWSERCWFAYEPEKTLVQYLCNGWEYDFSDLFSALERIEDAKEDIEDSKRKIENPGEEWKTICTLVYRDDGTEEWKNCYKSVEEYIASEKEYLEEYKEELEEALEVFQEIHSSFNTYMKDDEYVWEEEVRKAEEWYKENIGEKLDR